MQGGAAAAGLSKNARRRANKKKQQQQQQTDKDDLKSAEDGEAVAEALQLPIESVVKVYATLTPGSFSTPWTNEDPEDVSGSGFVIENGGKKYIATNAHVVANTSFLMVRQLGEAKKVKAKIEHISHELDLALLSADPSFLRDIAPLKLNASEPFLSDVVYVVGYPEGGDTISVTKGIVSRIEAGPYTETLDALQVQIDAAINGKQSLSPACYYSSFCAGGNSGGPVFGRGNAMIGIAFASLDDAENCGYAVPTRILNHFLESIRRFGTFKGVCRLGIAFQYMENAALAEFKRMGERSGVLVTQIDPCSPCHGVMVPGDVLLKIDGVEIADDGTVRWRKHERVNMEFVIQSRFPGDECRIEFLREGKVETGRITLKHLQPLVLDTFDARPTYVFYGGLVLVPFSTPFLDTYEDAPEELTVLLKTARRTHPDEEIVVLSSVVADDITIGYEEFEGQVLKSVCGTKVLNLRHAYSLLTSPNLPEMVQLVFGDGGSDNLCIFKKSEVAAASRKIMRRHKIPKDTNLDDKDDDN